MSQLHCCVSHSTAFFTVQVLGHTVLKAWRKNGVEWDTYQRFYKVISD